MNIALKDSSSSCWRELFRQTKEVREQAECIVPDVYEDVGQIVSAQAQICLKSKDVSDRSVEIGAEAEISVFYITESRDRVRCVRFSKDLRIGFDSPSIEGEAAAQISLCCAGVRASAVNPRKLAAQISVRAELSCRKEDCICVPSGTEESALEGLQLKYGSEDCLLTARVSEKSFVVNEQIPLDASEEPTALSCVRAKLIAYDHQPIGSKLLLKGGAQLTIAYETREGSCPRFMECCLPFSVLIDLPDEDCFPGPVVFEPTALYADLGDAINGSRVVNVELHATAQYSVERKETISYLTDAYSTHFPAILTERAVPVCMSRSEEVLTAKLSEQIPVESERGEIVSAFPEILSFGVRDAHAELSAAVSVLLRADDGSYSAQQRLLSVEAPLPGAEGEITGARITDFRAVREGEEIVLNLSAAFDHSKRTLAELRCLGSIELDTDNAFELSSLPSLTIARRGERDLWELARLCHSSVEAIEKTQREFPMPGDLLLIPRV